MSELIYAPGAVGWAELTTRDATAAKAFYSKVLGWRSQDHPMPGGGVYTMFEHADGGRVGGLRERAAGRRSGANPRWIPYIAVTNASETAAKVARLGGTVVSDVRDVLDLGTAAAIQDATGAECAVWQPSERAGFDHGDGRPGTFFWAELMTRDLDAAGRFYSLLFPWTPKFIRDTHHEFRTGEVQQAGMTGMSGPRYEGLPTFWSLSFAVPRDCDATVEQAKALGANVLVPPTDIAGVGRYAILQDPQGAAFSIVKLV